MRFVFAVLIPIHSIKRQIVTNGGFFITNLVSFLHPTPLTLTTPAELQPYGWTTTDLWSAPLVTGIYATLTHAQPFWADLHAVLAGMLGGAGAEKIAPLDSETARSACALVLAVLFASRTASKFGLVWKRGEFGLFLVSRRVLRLCCMQC